MARHINRLSAIKVSKTTEPGLYADGAGLYLQISKSGAKSWILRYMLRGKGRDMGLGSANVYSLADARAKAADYRKMLKEGTDPISARNEAQHAAALREARVVIFQECADRYIEAHSVKWKNAKHIYQWKATLKDKAGPIIGHLPVQDVTTDHIMKVLKKIWYEMPETASRLRGRIENVLDWATVMEYRPQAPNPARWRGHLDHLLPSIPKSKRVVHQPALPYVDMPEFYARLRAKDMVSARALEFLIGAACRTTEVTDAQRTEIDRVNRIWTIPAIRMKAGREHRVPLTDRMIEILDEMAAITGKNPYIFPNYRGEPYSDAAMMALLKRMDYRDITVHGFRSTFRDWVRDCTTHPRELAEAALAHRIEDETEAAYARSDMLDRRRPLMSEWGAYCAGSQQGEAC